MVLALLAVAALAAGGTLESRVPCTRDPTRSYALYRPAGYVAEAEWPVLVVMDPRGRAEVGAAPFLEAADSFGWVVVSSWDTASDALGEDPNGRAVAAVLTDLEDRVRVDPDAIALAGLSGTARVAWALGAALPTAVYGVLSIGAGLARGQQVEVVPFAVFGAAGDVDFNLQEVRRTDELLAHIGASHRYEIFPGGHEWVPPEVAARMVGWLEVEGQRRGRRPSDPARIDEALRVDRAWLAATTDPYLRWTAADVVARTYEGLRDVSAEAAEAARLAEDRGVRSRARLEDRIARDEEAYRGRLATLEQWLGDNNRAPPTPAEGLVLLGASTYVERARRHPGEPVGRGAARVLALTKATLEFYAPRAAFAREDPRRAAASLAIAAELDPASAVLRYNLACAWALAGASPQALTALEEAARLGFADRSHLQADADLASLRGEPRYLRVLEGMSPRE